MKKKTINKDGLIIELEGDDISDEQLDEILKEAFKSMPKPPVKKEVTQLSFDDILKKVKKDG